MFQTIEDLAESTVLRGCWLAASAALGLMMQQWAEPSTALLVGGWMALMLCSSLSVLAMCAPRIPYGATPVWSMLRPGDRPSPVIAQRVIGSCLRVACLKYAMNSATAAAGLLVTSLLVTTLGLTSISPLG